MEEPVRIGRYDQVKLLSTKNISYLSAPPGSQASPQGIWSVVAAVDNNQLLLVKNNVVIRAPATDVLKMVSFDLNRILDNLGKLSHGKKDKREKRDLNPPEHPRTDTDARE
jgi:hypothetical protein